MNMRHSTFIGIGVLMVVASVSACGATPDNTPQNLGGASPTSKVQSCQSLLDEGWTPPRADPSFNVDPKTWIVDVEFDSERVLVLDLQDPACEKLPDIGAPLAGIIPEYEVMREQECTDALADVLAGKPPTRGEVVGSLDALRQHVLTWCPPTYGERLLAAEQSVP